MSQSPPNPLEKASNVPYVWAIVVMILIGVVAVLAIVLMRPDKDNTQLIATIVSMVVPTAAAILALMKAQETHLTVNSQLAQWKLDFANLQRAEGEKEGRALEQARVAAMKTDDASRRTPEIAPPPIPVVIENPEPVPVSVSKDKK